MCDGRAPAPRPDYTVSEKWTSRQKLNIDEQLFKENWFPVGLFLFVWMLLGCPSLAGPGGSLHPSPPAPGEAPGLGYRAGWAAGKDFISMLVFKKVAVLSDGDVGGCFSGRL